MPPRIAKFEKVSYRQMCNDCRKLGLEPPVIQEFDSLPLPTRATSGSSGYDFCTPIPFTLAPGESIIIPTGVRAWIDPSWTLFAMPKSGLGFKYRLQLDNTVGNIDSDYPFSDNEGHILAKITNDSRENKTIEMNKLYMKFMQGVFIPYGITIDDHADGVRNGGFGSTGA